MEDFRSIAWELKPTADFLHDYTLRKFKSEGKDRSGSAPYFNKRNRKKRINQRENKFLEKLYRKVITTYIGA